jgi:hypothetical protein
VVDAIVLAGEESAEIVCRVRVVDFDGVAILSSDPADDVPLLRVTDAKTNNDDTADIKGTSDVSMVLDAAYESLVPLGAGSPLSPISEVEVEVWLGALNPETGEPDLDLQGTYEITETDISEDSGSLTVSMNLEDKHRKIQRARFFRPRQFPQKMSIDLVIKDLLISIIPESKINITPTLHITPTLSWDVQDDRLEAVNGQVTSIGYIMRFDGPGDAQIHPDTDPGDDPIWSFVQGPETDIETIVGRALATQVKRTLSDRETYNGVIALGEPTGSNTRPVRAEAWDTNPASLTYFDPTKPDESRYGPVPFFYSSPYITTQNQALSAAKAMLPKKAGIVERVQVTTLLNARVKCGDVALVERPRIGAQGTFIVESVEKNASGTMTVVLRERRLFS